MIGEGWALAVKELLALVRELRDPNFLKALEELKRLKSYKKAADEAEDAFTIVEKILKLVDVPESKQKKYCKLLDKFYDKVDRFNKYD